jgi:hypothetical protein
VSFRAIDTCVGTNVGNGDVANNANEIICYQLRRAFKPEGMDEGTSCATDA